jgi:hypothetical protein
MVVISKEVVFLGVGSVLAVAGAIGLSRLIVTHNDSAPAAAAADQDAPLTIIGAYSCRGWTGAIVIDKGGRLHSIPVTPAQAAELAKNAGIPADRQYHVFPAQGDCAVPDGDATKEWHDPVPPSLGGKNSSSI